MIGHRFGHQCVSTTVRDEFLPPDCARSALLSVYYVASKSYINKQTMSVKIPICWVNTLNNMTPKSKNPHIYIYIYVYLCNLIYIYRERYISHRPTNSKRIFTCDLRTVKSSLDPTLFPGTTLFPGPFLLPLPVASWLPIDRLSSDYALWLVAYWLPIDIPDPPCAGPSSEGPAHGEVGMSIGNR